MVLGQERAQWQREWSSMGLGRLSARAWGALALFPPDPQVKQAAGEIREISRQYGVDPTLVEAIVRAESAFNRTAVSPKGAGGLMQLMPLTAAALGVLDRFEPRESIRGGVRHLRYLLDRYQGSVALAVAAYNAGEGAVDAHRGIPPYPETEQYVQRVLQRAGVTDPRGPRQGLYRYVGPDDAVTYSNLPPESRPMVPHEGLSLSRRVLH